MLDRTPIGAAAVPFPTPILTAKFRRGQREGHKVCFVGDGINDVIALKKANVSISLRGATSITTSTAHVVFMEQSLRQIVRAARHRPRPRTQCPRQLADDPRPKPRLHRWCICLGFGIGASVITNNVTALLAFANGLLQMHQVAELEAEQRHILEM